MIVVSYGREGRPISRIAERLARDIESGPAGRPVRLVAGDELPEALSLLQGDVAGVVALWWRAAAPVLRDLGPGVRLIVAVYDHESWVSRPAEFERLAQRAAVVFACNRRLLSEVRTSLERSRVGVPVRLLEDGVDTEMFCPGPGPAARESGPLRVGWAGDPSLDRVKRTRLLRSAAGALDDIDLVGVSGLPHEEMLDWYRSLDLYVCASSAEGTPNPILEAAACGIPFVSTSVGVVPEIHDQTGGRAGWIVEGRNEREALVDGLRAAMAAGRRGLRQMGRFGRAAMVETWTWENRFCGVLEALGGHVPADPGSPPPVVAPAPLPPPLHVSAPGPPRVVVVYDRDGWAFHRIALQIQRYLCDDYEIEIVAYPDIPRRGQLWVRGFDAVINLAYFGVGEVCNSIGTASGGPPVITCVYDHYLWAGRHRGALSRAVDNSALVMAANAVLRDQVAKAFGARVTICSVGPPVVARRPRGRGQGTPGHRKDG